MELFVLFFLLHHISSLEASSCFQPNSLKGWLRSHQKQGLSLFCRNEIPEESITEDPRRFYFLGSRSCLSKNHFNGVKFDSSGRPYGRGSMNLEFFNADDGLDHDAFCINVIDGMQSVKGSFVDGYPEGNVKIRFSNGDYLEGFSRRGILHGKTRIYRKTKELQFLGIFSSGRPSGWSWVYPNNFETDGIILVTFDEGGQLDLSQTIYLKPGLMSGYIGKIENGTSLIVEHDIDITDVVEENCIYQIKYSKSKKTREIVIIPVYIRNADAISGLDIRSNQIFVFNRIAKTGSQSITQLLISLKPDTGVDVKVDLRPTESLMEPFNFVKAFTQMVSEAYAPTVFVRHYNFVDFGLYGNDWSPIYINIVRNPIERVISWFYYQRASWNIIERMQAFPNEPLPESKFLRKDFSTCVLDANDNECTFIEGTSSIDYVDHRNQVMAFCGHELYCADFNSQRALQKAKENVERFYPVVGVIEALNQSLTVFTDRFPSLFPRASIDLYHSSEKVKHKKITNNLKPHIPQEIIDVLSRNFTREIEFYDFCKQRLQNQYDIILNKNVT
eukprot:TRINITY_DN2062_c0_g1_i1.p1 TRINITY_DN2062_c0_g1~~TRINITY_DN2062_c0_g1_i1.p1  ORF type:complete len:559 (-),score=52.45 TRINITY_DN2062_c0_g1_i1:143-1819(-)